MSTGINVTTFDDLKTYARGQLVELPPFAEGQPFNAYMRRPSMLAMMKSGKIPNALLNAANSLFTGTHQQVAQEDEDTYKEVFQITELLADAALVNPSLKQVQEAGLELTDDQYMYIFNYTQRGVKALENFREEPSGTSGDSIKQNLSSEA